MSRTDLISDSLTVIRNAALAKKEDVTIFYSGIVFKICEILKNEGYIENFRKIEEGKKSFIKVYLKYRNKKSVFSRIRRVSKPSLRVYARKDKIPWILRGKGMALISTSKGILTDAQSRKAGLGGEVLFYIW